MKEKNSNKRGSNKNKLRIGKIVIKDVKKFSTVVITFIICIILLCVLISNLADKDINDIEDLSSINASKHYAELLELYEKQGMLGIFLTDYNKVQNAVGLYIINNSTLEENSFDTIIKDVNKILSKSDWTKELNVSKPLNWNGKWSTDNDGIVKFQFSNKNIEPSWLVNEEIVPKVVKN